MVLVVFVAAAAVLVSTVLVVHRWLTAPPRAIGLSETVDHYRQSTSTSTSTESDISLAFPVPGVYEYATSGQESVDALGGDAHTYPTDTAMTVTAEGCGYRVTWAPVEGRLDSSLLCRQNGGLALAASTNRHEFFRQSDREEFVCDPGVWWLPPPGITSWTAVCRSSERVSTRQGRVVGVETVAVGDARRDALHIRYDDELSQGSTGTTTSDLWLDPQTGLVLRERDRADTANDTVVGHVTFEERIDLELRSPAPHT